MKNVHVPITWNDDKYGVPYTSNTLGTETISSLAQKLLLNKKASSIEEALEIAKEKIKTITNRQ